MTLCSMGNGYSRTFSDRSGPNEVPVGSSGLFQQVARGRAVAENICLASSEICMEVNLPVQSS